MLDAADWIPLAASSSLPAAIVLNSFFYSKLAECSRCWLFGSAFLKALKDESGLVVMLSSRSCWDAAFVAETVPKTMH